jgi:16S rRNA (uracil1498-N3)-methyltransferase
VSAARFFVPGIHEPGDVATLEPDDARKVLVVLRRTEGARLEIVDSAGRTFAATLVIDGTAARASLEFEVARPPGATLRITLAQGIPKGQKMDFVVEKATELGVTRIVPFASERTVVGGPREGKVERWRRIARSAAAQCGRSDVPVVDEPARFADLIATIPAYDVALIPWELTSGPALRDVLPGLVANARDALVVIGPEGGLAHAEVDAARERGAHAISLGSRIFRTETAGLVACSALLYASGDL